MARRAKGEFSAYRDRRKGGWIASGDHPKLSSSKNRKRITAKGKTKTEALDRLRDKIDTLSRGVSTFGDLHQRWVGAGMPGRRSKSASTKTMFTHLADSHVLPAFGDVALADIRAEAIEVFLEDVVTAKGLSLSTVKKLRSIMSQVFHFGESRRHVDWNPARLATLPETKPEREGRALTVPEVTALLNVADKERLGAWVHVTASMGLRPGEASGLRWNRIDLDEGVAVIDTNLAWHDDKPVLKATKTAVTRTIKIPDPTLERLSKHRHDQNLERMAFNWPNKWSDLVFLSQGGTPLSPPNVRRLISRIAAEAGIEGKVVPYDCRHSAASILAAQGVPPLILAQLLGHKDTRVLERYYVHKVSQQINVAADNWPQADSGTSQ